MVWLPYSEKKLYSSKFLCASLYFSKRGAYWDRLCRDVVGCHARVLWPNGAYSYYGTLIGTPTPGIQWYKFRPPGVTPNREWALFVKLQYWKLPIFARIISSTDRNVPAYTNTRHWHKLDQPVANSRTEDVVADQPDSIIYQYSERTCILLVVTSAAREQ